jgi:hypothetical protein
MTSHRAVVLLAGAALVVLALWVLQDSPRRIWDGVDTKQRCESYPSTATRALLAGCLQSASKPEDCAYDTVLWPSLGIPQECNLQSQFTSVTVHRVWFCGGGAWLFSASLFLYPVV